MRNKDDRKNLLLFLAGCFSMTQINIIGYIGISELFFYAIAPLLFFKNKLLLKKHGVMPVLYLALFWLASAVLTDFMRGTPFLFAIKGVAAIYSILAAVICLHELLYSNLLGFKWLLFGFACSLIICVFIFQPGSDRVTGEGELLAGSEAVAGVMSYKLFWVSRINTWLKLPVQMYYVGFPFPFSLAIILYVSMFSLLEGGRSVFLINMIGFFIILVGGNKLRSMLRLKKHFGFLMASGMFGLFFIWLLYKIVVTGGFMGNSELDKFEQQTAGAKDPLTFIMAGRSEFFIGLFAAIDSPIIGHGSRAFDTKGYALKFLTDYGNAEDFELYQKRESLGLVTIPAHSHIVSAWVWHGLAGAVFWIYIVCLLIRTLRYNMAAVPEWFGYLALSIAGSLWAVLFSPLGVRVNTSALIIICILAQAVSKGQLQPEYLQNRKLMNKVPR